MEIFLFCSIFLMILSPFIIVFMIPLCFFITQIIPEILFFVGSITPTRTNRTATNTRTTTHTYTKTTDNYRFKDLPDDIDNILRDLNHEEIKDPITQETFKPGDTVYLCHRHRLAYHEDSWNEIERKCINCGNDAHTKKYTIPLISKINPTKEILWNDITNYPPKHFKNETFIESHALNDNQAEEIEKIPLDFPNLPRIANLEQPEPIEEVVNDRRRNSVDGGEREDARSRHFYHGSAHTNLYRLIDRLTQLPTLEVFAVQNVLGVIFYEADTNNYITKYAVNNLRGTPFYEICLFKSTSNRGKISVYLVMASNVQILLSDIIIHYNLLSENRQNFLLPNRQGLLIPHEFEQKIGNYRVRFYADTNEERNLKKLWIYSHGF